jgi:hypothetical protein
MSLATVRAGLYTTLTACGPWSGCEVSTCDFGGLESNSGCCITFLPDGQSEIIPLSDGTFNSRHYTRAWRIGGTLWIRDNGTATVVLNKLWQSYDDLYNTLSKDDSLNGAAAESHVAIIANKFGQFVRIGGQQWKPVNFVVIAQEF